MIRKAALLTLTLAPGACAAETPRTPPADPAVLMEADRAFDAAVSEGGASSWVTWFAEDGAMVREGAGEIRGIDRIRQAIASLDNPGVALRWQPTRSDIAASGDLGWTTGTYVSTATLADGTTTRGEGVYVSIWRLQGDGSWKVVMDLGNPTQRPQPVG